MCRNVVATLVFLGCSLVLGQSPAGPAVSQGDQSRAAAEVGQILKDLAVAKHDAKELERLYADEFTQTNASGQVLDKAAVISRKGVSVRSLTLDEVTIQIYGDIAVAKTSERIEGNTVSGRFRHLRVFIKRDGRWQIIATQMTKIAEQ